MSQSQINTCEKKIKTAEHKITKILGKIDSLKLNHSYILKLDVQGKRKKCFSFPSSTKLKIPLPSYATAVAVISLLIFGASWVYNEWPSNKVLATDLNKTSRQLFLEARFHYILSMNNIFNHIILCQNCHLHLPSSTTGLFRPPEDCSMCVGVTGAVRLANTSAAEFEQYAYSATPVIVTDATTKWRAVREFSFKFFADFYNSGKMGSQINDCFFFAYKSGLHSLQEVFAMDEARANLSGEPWYIGWSTCYDEETRKLRQYYNRPYFLPETAESDMVDWIFMGGPGQGAHMHVDSVKHMSWQAQLRGRKQWQLAPPPECLYRCSWLTFTVSPGEILVVDTNRWYHKTNVLPGDISITIGAEYD